jgi:regulation of enolase protein 1 (concanavalin A-like superfamily)
MKRFDDDMTWLNPPAGYVDEGNSAVVVTKERTDFWRHTFYGFVHDNGHFLYRSVKGDFTAEVTISAKYSALYDQAGLMLRLDEQRWLKAGIEYTDGITHFSVVISNGYSDWSVVSVPEAFEAITLRLTRHAEAVRVQYKDRDGRWQMARLGYLPFVEAIDVGIMCCSPERQGFEARFSNLKIGPAIPRTLHS